jgi:hypothetical protein
VAPPPSRSPLATSTGIACTAAAAARPTALCGAAPWSACTAASPPKGCIARRTAEGKTKTEIKRYITREVFPLLVT